MRPAGQGLLLTHYTEKEMTPEGDTASMRGTGMSAQGSWAASTLLNYLLQDERKTPGVLLDIKQNFLSELRKPALLVQHKLTYNICPAILPCFGRKVCREGC